MGRPIAVETIAALRESLAASGGIALVPTMGALHDGHLALVDRAAELAHTVVVSIFVNPTQFGPGEDLTRYPRDLEADLDLLEGRGVDLVFAPSVDEMYPDGDTQISVTGGPVAALYEGSSRPGHFDGVLTVMMKLLGIVSPQHVVFGQKDAQQVFLVQQMVRDLNTHTILDVVETVRATDGLALSSRNRFLDAEARRAALALSRALDAAAASGAKGIDAVLAAAGSVLADEDLVKLDYLKVVNPSTFLPVDADYRGPARMLIAARVGETRLIDNKDINLN